MQERRAEIARAHGESAIGVGPSPPRRRSGCLPATPVGGVGVSVGIGGSGGGGCGGGGGGGDGGSGATLVRLDGRLDRASTSVSIASGSRASRARSSPTLGNVPRVASVRVTGEWDLVASLAHRQDESTLDSRRALRPPVRRAR
jgi:hypothetical protein